MTKTMTKNFSIDQLVSRDADAIQGAHNVLNNPKLAITHKANASLFKNKAMYLAAFIAGNTPGGWAKLASYAIASGVEGKAPAKGKLHARVKDAMIELGYCDTEVSDNAVSNYRRPVAALAYVASEALKHPEKVDAATRIMAASLPLQAYRPMGTVVESNFGDDLEVESLGAIGLDAQDKANAKAAEKKAPEKVEAGINPADIKACIVAALNHVNEVNDAQGKGVTLDGKAAKAISAAIAELKALAGKL